MSEKLPKENQTLMIVNCTKTWQEVVDNKVYICPSVGAAYNYRPARYFGVYHSRKVSHVANIEAVIDVQLDGTTNVRWTALSFKEAEQRQKAVEQANQLRPKADFPVQVIILGVVQPTDFTKESPGGMFGSVKYLDVSGLEVDTAGYLAMKLRDKNWSQVGTDMPKVREAKAAASGSAE